MTPPIFHLDDEVETTDGKRFKISQIWKNQDGSISYSALREAYHPSSSLRLVSKFKKGDLVEIIGPSPNGHVSEIGKQFVIKETGNELDWMGTIYKDCYSAPVMYPYKASSLRLVEKGLKIGDWVEVIGPTDKSSSGHVIGNIFQIQKTAEHGGSEFYTTDGIPFYSRKELRKLTPEEIQQNQAIETVPGIRGKYANIDWRLSAIEERLGNIDRILGDRWELHTQWRDRLSDIGGRVNKLGPSHSELLGDVGALAEKVGAIEKRQKEQHERIDRFMQDYREHKDFDFDMHDRIKVLEGERPEVCEPAMNDIGAIAAIASFGPVPECVAAFIRHETEEAEKRKQKGTCDEEDCKPNMKPIRITIQIGKNKVYIMHPETCCPGDALKWCETVLDIMREA